MNVKSTVTAIGYKIQSQGCDKVGIRMGYDLYRELWSAGHITREKFVVEGAKVLFPGDFARLQATLRCLDRPRHG